MSQLAKPSQFPFTLDPTKWWADARKDHKAKTKTNQPHLTAEAAEPFFYHGDGDVNGKIGILLIHGFTGTPFVFKEVGDELASQGYTVSAPLVAGHGTSPDDLAQTSWKDWYKSIDQAYEALITAQCKEVFVIGASFGSNLAMYLAAKRPVAGLVLIGTPRWIYKQLLATIFTPVFILFGIKYYVKEFSKTIVDGSLLGGPLYSYTKIPMKSVVDFFKFVGEVTDKILPKITVPTLLIQSINDGLVKPQSGEYIFKNIASQNKQLIWIDEPHHQLHTGKNRKQIYGYINEFIVRWQ